MEAISARILTLSERDLIPLVPVKVPDAHQVLSKIGFHEGCLATLSRQKYRVMDNYRDALNGGVKPRSRWIRQELSAYFSTPREGVGSQMISEAEVPDSLTALFDLPVWAAPNRSVRFFAGRAKCVSDMHIDWFSYWLMHINLLGKKRFMLLPPAAGGAVMPVANLASLDVRSMSDNERQSLIASADGVELVLGPGEGLLQPPLWWHHVDYETDAASLSIGFGPLNEYVSSFFRDVRLPRDWRLAILYSVLLRNRHLTDEGRNICERVREVWSKRTSAESAKQACLKEALKALTVPGATPSIECKT